MRGFSFKKSVQALNLFAINNGGKINKMKAIKLIWLADRLHIRMYGRTITGDTYFALQNGPIPSATRDILEKSNFVEDIAKDYSSEYISEIDNYNYESIAPGKYNVFSQTDLEVLEIIYKTFGELDHFALSEYSHKFPEWKKFEVALNNKISSRFEIEILDFYINVDEKSGLFNDDEEDLNISKSIYEENSTII